jgi:hypothetical protein
MMEETILVILLVTYIPIKCFIFHVKEILPSATNGHKVSPVLLVTHDNSKPMRCSTLYIGMIILLFFLKLYITAFSIILLCSLASIYMCQQTLFSLLKLCIFCYKTAEMGKTG